MDNPLKRNLALRLRPAAASFSPCRHVGRKVAVRLVRERERQSAAPGGGGGAPATLGEWDKDDADAMDFVAAAAALRCYVFKIPVKSRFHTKSMAGNISFESCTSIG